MNITLPAPVEGYIAASNAIDGDALIECFADDAFVNDARREFWGKAAIRAWLDREVIGDKVTMDVTATSAHYGDVAVDAVMDGQMKPTEKPPLRSAEVKPPVPSSQKLQSIKDFAASIGISVWTVRGWAYRGRIASIKLGARLMIPTTELDRLIEKNLRPAVGREQGGMASRV